MSTPKSQRTAHRISAAAADLFLAHGYSDTTIAQVAEQAQVAVGTVMLHFGSKGELATAAFSEQISEVVQIAHAGLSEAENRTLAEELETFVRPIYGWYQRHGEVAPDLLREALFSTGPWAEHYARTVAHTVTVFSAIASRHSGADADHTILGEGFLADYLLVLLRGIGGQFVDLDAQTAAFVSQATAPGLSL